MDLAQQLGASLLCDVVDSGQQERFVDQIDLFQFNQEDLYRKMYEDFVNGGGVGAEDVFKLHWALNNLTLTNGTPDWPLWINGEHL